MAGPVMEMITNLFGEFDVSVTSVPLPWARAITQIESGEIDMIPVIFYTEERSHYMEFSTPYAEVPTSIFVPRGSTFHFKNMSDLIGKRGVMMRGDSISAEFQAYRDKLTLTEIAGYDQMVRMLANRRADYGVAAEYGFILEIQRLGIGDEIEILPNPLALRNLHFALSRKSKHLNRLPYINKRINELKDNGTLEQMVNETISEALAPYKEKPVIETETLKEG